MTDKEAKSVQEEDPIKLAKAMAMRKARTTSLLKDFFPSLELPAAVTKPQLGFLHVYTGPGKGKTTASLGLVIRALGAGYRVAFLQFDKGYHGVEHYSERNVLRQLPNLTLLPTGCERIMPDGRFRFGNTEDDYIEALRGVNEAKNLILGGDHDVIILDELLSAIKYGLIKKELALEIIQLHKDQGQNSELVITGHGLPNEIREKADLITEMQNQRHYYQKGFYARKGIDF